MAKVSRRDVIGTVLLVVLFFCFVFFLPVQQGTSQMGPRTILVADDVDSGPAYKLVFPNDSLSLSGAVGTISFVASLDPDLSGATNIQ